MPRKNVEPGKAMMVVAMKTEDGRSEYCGTKFDAAHAHLVFFIAQAKPDLVKRLSDTIDDFAFEQAEKEKACQSST